jgi:D-3-phosphoglycerate dehydrogenase / 2-oxoglutarate reductase
VTRPLAFVTAEWPAPGFRALTGLGFEVGTGGWGVSGQALDTGEFARVAAGAAVLIVEVETVSDGLLDQLPDVSVVAAARGLPSNVDVAACTRRRIPVLHTPGRNAGSVADFVIGLIVSCCRGISAGERRLRSAGWMVGGEVPYRHFRGPELAGLTLGLIGFGSVGQRVAAQAAGGLNMRVIHYDPYVTDGGTVSTPAGLDTLLRTADIVSLHCSRVPETRGLIGAAELAEMKPTSYLINTAGGGIVDEAALVDALARGVIAGAALDVFATEPLPADSPLLRCERLLLTPHLAGAASDVPAHHATMICEDLARIAAGEPPRHCVNAADVLPITPPQQFAVMRASREFRDGIASRDLPSLARHAG